MKDAEKLKFQKVLTYTNGYRELGMHTYALKELANLTDEQTQSQTALQMRLAILMDANRWKKALTIARKLHAISPESADTHVNLAFVIRRAHSLKDAQSILINAAEKFPTEAIIPYNLGCYACQNADLDEAKTYLTQAFQLDTKYIEMAKKDEDLGELKSWVAQKAPEKHSKD